MSHMTCRMWHTTVQFCNTHVAIIHLCDQIISCILGFTCIVNGIELRFAELCWDQNIVRVSEGADESNDIFRSGSSSWLAGITAANTSPRMTNTRGRRSCQMRAGRKRLKLYHRFRNMALYCCNHIFALRLYLFWILSTNRRKQDCLKQ